MVTAFEPRRDVMATDKLRAALPSALLRTRYDWLAERLPGLLVCLTIGLATTFLSDHYGGPNPLLVKVLGLDHAAAGVFLGGTIHDVAQVVGAGYIISPETGDTSTVVKLMRVAMLVPVVLAFSLLFRQSQPRAGQAGRPPLLPLFLVAFVVLVLVNSAGLIPAGVAGAAADLSRWCLVTAIAALGIKTSLEKLAAVGWRPVALMVGETIFLAILVLGAVLGMSR
jgi:uncharacterized integral membrane protein (TIGR00698 family)